MARLGLFAEMVEDLRLAFQADKDSLLGDGERQILNLEPIYFLDEEGFWDASFSGSYDGRVLASQAGSCVF